MRRLGIYQQVAFLGDVPADVALMQSAGGLWRFDDTSLLYQTTDTSTPVTSDGQSVGRAQALSGTAVATQPAAGVRPPFSEGSGLSFDGGSDSIVTDFNPGSAGTIAAYLRVRTSNNSNDIAIGSQNNGTSNRMWIGTTSGGVPWAGIGNLGGSTLQGGGDIRSATVFHAIALTWEGGTAHLYLDGAEVDTHGYGGTLSSAILALGGRGLGGTSVDSHFDGLIRFAMIQARALSAGEISDLHSFWSSIA